MTLTVNQAPQAISFTNPGNHTYGDPPFTLAATGGASTNPVTFSLASGSTGCALSGANNATVTLTSATATGSSCVIDANQAGTTDYLAAPQVQQSFTIAKSTPTLSWTAPAPMTYGAALGSVLNAQASVPGTYRYTLNGQPVSATTVPDAGTSQPLAVTFTPTDTIDYTTAVAAQTITVNQAAQTVSVSPLGAHTYGDAPFTVNASSSNPALPLSYSTSGACTNNGPTVTIASAGTCSVTVSQAGDNDYAAANPVPVSANIAPYTPTVVWPTPAHLVYGTPLGAAELDASLSYTIDPSAVAPSPGSWTYTLPDSTVLRAGSILTAGAWTTTATWTPDPGQSATTYAPAHATVTITVDKATPTLSWSDQTVTYPAALDSTILDASVAPFSVGTGTVTPTGTITYTDDGGTTDSTGQVPGAGAHSLTATFTPDSASAPNFNGTALTVNLTVAKGNQVLIFTSPVQKATFGDPPFTVAAQGGRSTSPVVFSSTTPAVCSTGTSSLQPDGSYAAQVSTIGAGDCTVAADQAGDANYTAALEQTQDETVAKAAPTINWPTPAPIVYGTALSSTQLNAAIQQSDATGTFTYTLADGTPANGAVLNAGPDQPVTVAFHDSDGNYNDATATVYVEVTPAPQIINFAAVADHIYGDADFSVSATGGGSGNPVTFTASGNCTVSADGSLVHITGAGSCSLTAQQAGDNNYHDAQPVTQTFSIAKADQSMSAITTSVTTFTYGDAPFRVTASATSGLPVSFTASGACTNAGARVAITAAGTCAVTASQAGDDNYNAADPVSQDITIAKADQSITGFTLPATATYLDAPIATSPSGGASGQPVLLSTISAACSVSGLTVTILHAGTCTVMASQAGDDNYNAAPDVSDTIQIAKYSPSISWSPQGLSYGTVLGSNQLNAALNPDAISGGFTYSATDSTNNPVDITSTLHAGSYTLTASFAPNDSADVNTVAQSVPFTVSKADQTITFGAISGTHTYGDPPFNVSAQASSGLTVGFTAAAETATDCNVAPNGDSSGTVTILQAGGCTVVASQAGNGDYNPAPPVSQSFTANQATPSITWPTPASITYGTAVGDQQLDATAIYHGSPVAGTLTYSPAAGTILHAGDRRLSVTFTPTDATNYASADATVTLHVDQAPQAITFPVIGDHTYGDADFSVSATGGASGKPVTFTAIGDCTVSTDGSNVHISGAGSCSVSASQNGNADYTAAPNVTQTFNIARAPQIISTITPSVSSFSYGDPNFTASATGGSSGNFVTFTATGSCSSGGTNGATIAILTAGPCTITASQNGNTNYLDASPVTQTFTVAKADQTITFPPIIFGTAGAAQGSTATLTATATSHLPITYSATGTCTVNGSALTLANAAGTCTVTASQPGTGNFNPAPGVSQSFTTYNFGGFLPPIANKLSPSKGGPTGGTPLSFKQGSTIPVKFQFLNAGGVSEPLPSPPLFAITPSAANSNPATAGNTYQWDPTGQQYIYNLGTKNIVAGTTYTIAATLGIGGPSWSIQLTVYK